MSELTDMLDRMRKREAVVERLERLLEDTRRMRLALRRECRRDALRARQHGAISSIALHRRLFGNDNATISGKGD